MKLNIVDKGHSNVMNGADIPDGTVFLAFRCGADGLYIKYCRRNDNNTSPSITVISAPSYISGHVYKNPELMSFYDYKVVEELTAVVK